MEDNKEIAVVNAENYAKLTNLNEQTKFTDSLETAKIETLKQAATNDTKFIDEFKKELKEAALKAAQLEKEKQALEKQNIEYHQELLQTQQKLNEHQQHEDEWNARTKKRQYHYDGVKDVMVTIGIKNPMCIPLLYFLFPIALLFFIPKIAIQGTLGNLLAGAIDSDRPKAAKGFLWTLLVFSILCIITAGILITLQWLEIIKIK